MDTRGHGEVGAAFQAPQALDESEDRRGAVAEEGGRPVRGPGQGRDEPRRVVLVGRGTLDRRQQPVLELDVGAGSEPSGDADHPPPPAAPGVGAQPVSEGCRRGNGRPR